jgi:hypothetical protein
MNETVLKNDVEAPQTTTKDTGLAASVSANTVQVSTFDNESFVGFKMFSQRDKQDISTRSSIHKRRLVSAGQFIANLLKQVVVSVALGQLRLSAGIVQAITQNRFVRTNCPFAGGNRVWNTITELCDVSPYYIYSYGTAAGAASLQVNTEGRPLVINFTSPRTIPYTKFSTGFQKYAAKIDTAQEARWADINMTNAMNTSVMAASLAIRFMNTAELGQVERTEVPYGAIPLCFPAVKLIQLAQTKWPVSAADFWMKRNIPAGRYDMAQLQMKAHSQPLAGWTVRVKYISAVDYFDNTYGNKSGTANAVALKAWAAEVNPTRLVMNSRDLDANTAILLMCCYLWDPAGSCYLSLPSDDGLKLAVRRYIDDYRIGRTIDTTVDILLVDMAGGVNAPAVPTQFADFAVPWTQAVVPNSVAVFRPPANADIFDFLQLENAATIELLKNYLVMNHAETFCWCVEWQKSRYLGSTPYPMQNYERNGDLTLAAVLPSRTTGVWGLTTRTGYPMNANQLPFEYANRDLWITNSEFGFCSNGGPEDQSFFNRELGFGGTGILLHGMSFLSQLVEIADNMLTTETSMMKKGLLMEADLVNTVETAMKRFIWLQTSTKAAIQSRSLLMLNGNQGSTPAYVQSLSPLEASGAVLRLFEEGARKGIFEPYEGRLRPSVTRPMEYLFTTRDLAVESAYHTGLVFVNEQAEQMFMGEKEQQIPYVGFKLMNSDQQDEQKFSRNVQFVTSGVAQLDQNVSVFVSDILNPKLVEKIVSSAGLAQVQQGFIAPDYTIANPRDCLFAYVPTTPFQVGITRIAFIGNPYVAGRKQYFSNIIGPSGAVAITSCITKTLVERPDVMIRSWEPIPQFSDADFGG